MPWSRSSDCVVVWSYFQRVCVALLASCLFTAPAGAEGFRYLLLDGHLVKWGSPELGAATTVSYRIADRTHSFSEARNCRSLAPPTALLERSDIGIAAFRSDLEAAFAMWQAAAGIAFVPAADGETADILIGAQGSPAGIAFADVHYDREAQSAIKPIRRGLICLNPQRQWRQHDAAGPADAYDLQRVLAHEIGHAIGLNHAGPRGALMSFVYDENLSTLQAGDIAGALALYGADEPPANAAAIVETSQSPTN